MSRMAYNPAICVYSPIAISTEKFQKFPNTASKSTATSAAGTTSKRMLPPVVPVAEDPLPAVVLVTAGVEAVGFALLGTLAVVLKLEPELETPPIELDSPPLAEIDSLPLAELDPLVPPPTGKPAVEHALKYAVHHDPSVRAKLAGGGSVPFIAVSMSVGAIPASARHL